MWTDILAFICADFLLIILSYEVGLGTKGRASTIFTYAVQRKRNKTILNYVLHKNKSW
jgi:hypothetical protein